MRTIKYFLPLLVLSGCSIPRTTVISSSNEQIAAVKSYYLYPIQLGPTLADSTEISAKLPQLASKAEDQLKESGKTLGPVKSADSLIKITIQTAPTGQEKPDELRFMKGGARNGSNFPDANPRVRSLEADFMKIDIILIDTNQSIFSAKCQLIENQEIMPGEEHGSLKLEDAESCLSELSSSLP